MLDTDRIAPWFVAVAASGFSSVAFATDRMGFMPPLWLLVLPLLVAIALSIGAWYLTRLIEDPTVRSFSRVVIFAALWTLVPVRDSVLWLPGCYAVILAWFAQSGELRLDYVIAVAATSILGALLVVLNSAARLYSAGRR